MNTDNYEMIKLVGLAMFSSRLVMFPSLSHVLLKVFYLNLLVGMWSIDLWNITTADLVSINSALCMGLPKNPKSNMSQEIDPIPAKNGEFQLGKKSVKFK